MISHLHLIRSPNFRKSLTTPGDSILRIVHTLTLSMEIKHLRKINSWLKNSTRSQHVQIVLFKVNNSLKNLDSIQIRNFHQTNFRYKTIWTCSKWAVHTPLRTTLLINPKRCKSTILRFSIWSMTMRKIIKNHRSIIWSCKMNRLYWNQLQRLGTIHRSMDTLSSWISQIRQVSLIITWTIDTISKSISIEPLVIRNYIILIHI